MRTVLYRSVTRIMVLMLALAILPTPTHAQDPAPPTPPAADDQLVSGTALLPDAAQPTVTAGALPPATAPTARATSDQAATVAPADNVTVQAATPGATRVTNPGFEIKVEPTNTVVAGGLITYTYRIKNLSGAAVSDAMLQAWWNDRDTGYNLMTCTWPSAPTLCVPINATISTSPATPVTVTKVDCSSLQPALSLCYTLPTIPAAATLEVSLQLRAQNSIFPQTNRGITELAGSGRIVRTGTPTQADSFDNTNNTKVVGPVLTGRKTAVKPVADPVRGRIYTGDNGTFNLEVGNATGDGDKSNGVIRSDARDATNIVVTDQIPAGSTFVSATAPGGTFSQVGTTIVWNFPGPLKPGETIKFEVAFKKVGQGYDRGQCDALRNNSWNVTSAEYPNGPEGRYVIGISGAEIPVIPPVYLQAISFEPNTVFYGEKTRVTITLRNYWPEAVENATLTYSLQKNVDLGGNATPGGAAQEQGRSYKWTVNLPAGSMDQPTDVAFSIDLIGTFDSDPGNLGVAEFDTKGTTNLKERWDCPRGNPYPIDVKPRLYIRKYSDSTKPRDGNLYLVSANSEFEYAIDVKNNSTTNTATNVKITDTFPTAPNARFSYIGGSSSGPAQPTQIAGGLRWVIDAIPAGQTLTLRYRLNVQGDDYVPYCNLAEAKGNNNELVGVDPRGNQICVKINPDIRLTKTVDKKVINLNPDQNDEQSRANRTVRFTLTIKNNEAFTYTANLADSMGYFIFKNAVPVAAPAIDAGRPTVKDAYYVWPLVTLQPGEIRTAVFDAEVPNVCNSGTLVNKALFQNTKYLISPVPEVAAQVQVNCGRVDYEIFADRGTVSLRDRIIYTLKLTNNGTTDAADLQVENRLPNGFTFVSLETDSTIKALPTQAISNTYTTLRWTVPKVAVGQAVYIKYRATSGDAVIQGNQNSEGAWLRLLQNGSCPIACFGDPTGGPVYAVHNIRVEPLATLEPKIAESGCAKSGATRTYTLSIVNRNSHPYSATDVSVTLPMGLMYSKALGATAEPSVVQDGNQQRLIWGNQTIASPQGGQSFVQNDYSIELKVGNTFGALRVISAVTSADGTIPRKEGVVDPTVFVCIDKPLLAISADRSLVKPGGEVAIQITLANPLITPYTISIKNQLPAELAYLSYEGGQGGKQPTVTASDLTWSDLVVPATNGDQYGVIVLSFRVRLSANVAVGQAFDSIVSVLSKTPDSLAIDTTQNKVTVRAAIDTYLPLANQKR